MEDLKSYLPVLMVAAGGALQWARQFRAFREEWYHAIAVLFGVGAYLLVMPFEPVHWRMWFLSCLEFLTIHGGLAQIWGGTFIASNGAKALAVANPSAGATFAVPVTNSK